MDWQPIETAPKDGLPFLLGIEGGVLLELWHWHEGEEGPIGCYSHLQFKKLKSRSPDLKFFWARPDAPPEQ